MKRADIKVGQVYGYRPHKWSAIQPVLVLDDKPWARYTKAVKRDQRGVVTKNVLVTEPTDRWATSRNDMRYSLFGSKTPPGGVPVLLVRAGAHHDALQAPTSGELLTAVLMPREFVGPWESVLADARRAKAARDEAARQHKERDREWVEERFPRLKAGLDATGVKVSATGEYGNLDTSLDPLTTYAWLRVRDSKRLTISEEDLLRLLEKED